MTIPKERELHTAVDTNDDGDIRLVAECDDEMTMLVITNPAALGKTPQDYIDSMDEWGPMLLTDHMAQCKSCQTHLKVRRA
jgi:hypothetical protein